MMRLIVQTNVLSNYIRRSNMNKLTFDCISVSVFGMTSETVLEIKAEPAPRIRVAGCFKLHL